MNNHLTSAPHIRFSLPCLRVALLCLSVTLFAACARKAPLAAAPPPVSLTDAPYLQEFGRAHTALPDLEGVEIISLAVDDSDAVWIGSAQGLFRFHQGALTRIAAPPLTGLPILALAASGSTVWVASPKGLHQVSADGSVQPAPPGCPDNVSVLHLAADGTLYAASPAGLHRLTDSLWTPIPIPAPEPADFALAPDGAIWIASKEGLWRGENDQWRLLTTEQGLPSNDIRALAIGPEGNLWAGTSEGLSLLGPKGESPRNFAGQQGLPWPDVTDLHLAADGSLLIPTTRGCAKLQAGQWRFYHSPRWLPDDRVNCAVRQQDGTVWMATPSGLARVEFREMTLQDKSDFFIRRIRERHIRQGFLAHVSPLFEPGNPASIQPKPSDNDGQWTAEYLAAESFRYATTGDQQARANAWESAQALISLQHVTGVPGLIARCIYRPGDPPDAYATGEWHDLPDGRKWKGDSSSDELVGHFFGLSVFYDLAAQGQEKAATAAALKAIMYHMLDHNYCLVDVDGEPTEWGRFDPQAINYDPEWQIERCLSSLELLSFLKTTYHLTGDDRYQQHYLDLIRNHHYALNVLDLRDPYFDVDNYCDIELAILAFYPLLTYETDPSLRSTYQEALMRLWRPERPARSPLVNILASALLRQSLDLEPALTELREIPVDMIDWRITNSWRQDIVVSDKRSRFRRLRGQVPVRAAERPLSQWDDDPFALDAGNHGEQENSGFYWLLPYWCARYHGLIVPAPQSAND